MKAGDFRFMESEKYRLNAYFLIFQAPNKNIPFAWIKTNPGKFDVSHDEFFGRLVHAEKSSDYYAFVPAQFEKLAEELRFSVKDYLDWARSVGILITDSDRGRFKKKVLLKSGDKPVACYCIRADIEQEADDAPQDSAT